jgi:hypothetical protein
MGRAIDCNIYRNTAAEGVGYGTPTLTNPVGNIMDLEITEDKEMEEITIRRGKGAKMYAPTTIEFAVSGKMLCPGVGAAAGNLDFDDYTAFNSAWNSNGVLDLLFLDDLVATIGASGVRGAFALSKWGQPQGVSNRLWRVFELKVTDWSVLTYATSPTAEPLRKALVGTGPALTYASLGSNTFA